MGWSAKRSARKSLKNGDYEWAAYDFEWAGMYLEAGDAWMCAATKEGVLEGWAPQHMVHAARAYVKGEYYDRALDAYVKAFNKGFGAIRDEQVNDLKSHGLWDRFCNKVIETMPPFPSSSDLESLGDAEFSMRCRLAIADKTDDRKQAFESTKEAIVYHEKAGTSASELLDLYVLALKRDRSDAFTWSGLTGQLYEDGLLEDFIEQSYHEAPAALWRNLYECCLAAGNRGPEKRLLNVAARGMLKCLTYAFQEGAEMVRQLKKRAGGVDVRRNTAERLEEAGLNAEAAKLYATTGRHADKTAECYKRAGDLETAAQSFEEAGKFKEAAALAEDAGDNQWAVRLYEQALAEENLTETEEEWIGTTLERLRGTAAGPSASETVPDDLEQVHVESSGACICPECGAELSGDDSFCGDCGCALGSVCANCGAEIREGKKFCGKCGQQVT